MEINIHNYEAFFLDYKEGNLGAAQVEELFAFLEQYPQLKAELDSFEEITLEPEISFENKTSLKKIELSDEAIIAYVEGVADEKTTIAVEKMAAENVAFGKEVKLYQSTIVAAEEVKFPNKAKLKRGGLVIYLQSNPAVLRVAAAILLLLGLFFLVSKLNTTENKEGSQPILADGVKKQNAVPVKNDEQNVVPTNEEKQLAVSNEEKKENIVTNSNAPGKQLIKNDPPKKNETPLLVNNTPSPVNTNSVIPSINNNNKGNDTLIANNKGNAVPVNTTTNTATYKSWYNYEVDNDKEEDKPVVTASSTPTKKTFFQKVTDAAKKANVFGVKAVDSKEEKEKNTLLIGGLVVTETTSN